MMLVFGSDNVGVSSLSVTVNNYPIDSKGQAFFTPTAAGDYTIVATATDAAGNTVTSTQTLTVSNPNGTPPTITLTDPTANENITAPLTLVGTVSDDNVGVSYTVTVIPFDGSPPKVIGSGSTTTSNSLAISGVTFDPTLLANGDYTIEIQATDSDDNLTTTLDRNVSVSGKLKLGRETLSVTDLTIPVAGIPLTVVRSYDSLNAGVSGDFGYGWSLSYGDAQLEVNLVPGAAIGWGGYPAFLNGTKVYVTMPGGQREGFTFEPQAETDLFGTTYHPYFVPDPGVTDMLTVPDALLQYDPDSGEYNGVTDNATYDTYNPADPNFGGTYTVTNVQGIRGRLEIGFHARAVPWVHCRHESTDALSQRLDGPPVGQHRPPVPQATQQRRPPRTYPLREIVNAVFYLAQAGCA